MKYEYPTWGYKKDGETRLFQAGEDVDRRVWKDTPAAFYDEEDEFSLEDLNKVELELYAREVYGVELDRRKTRVNMLKDLEDALNDGSRSD